MNSQQRALLRSALEATKNPSLDSCFIVAYISQIKYLLHELHSDRRFDPLGHPSKDIIFAVYILLHAHPAVEHRTHEFSVVEYELFYIAILSCAKKLERYEIDPEFYARLLQVLITFYINMPVNIQAITVSYDEKLASMRQKYLSLDAFVFKPLQVSLKNADTIARVPEQQGFLDVVSQYLKTQVLHGNRLDEAHQKASKDLDAIVRFFESISNHEHKARLIDSFSSIQSKMRSQMMNLDPSNHLKSLFLNNTRNDPLMRVACFAIYVQGMSNQWGYYSIIERMCLLRWLNFEINSIKLILNDEAYVLPEIAPGLEEESRAPICIYASQMHFYKSMQAFVRLTYNHLAEVIGVTPIDFLAEEAEGFTVRLVAEKAYIDDLFKFFEHCLDSPEVDVFIPPPATESDNSQRIDRYIAFMLGEKIDVIKIFLSLPPVSPSALALVLDYGRRFHSLFETQEPLVQFILARWMLTILHHYSMVDNKHLSKPFDLKATEGPSLSAVSLQECSFYTTRYNALAADFGWPVYIASDAVKNITYPFGVPASHDIFKLFIDNQEDKNALVLLGHQSIPEKMTPLHLMASSFKNNILHLEQLNGLIGLVRRGYGSEVGYLLLMKDKTKRLMGHYIVEHQTEDTLKTFLVLLSTLNKEGYQSMVLQILLAQDKKGNALGHCFSVSECMLTSGVFKYIRFLDGLGSEAQQRIHGLRTISGKTMWDLIYAKFSLMLLPVVADILLLPSHAGFSFKWLFSTDYKTDLLKTNEISLLPGMDAEHRTIFHYIALLKDHRLLQSHLKKWHQFAKKDPTRIISLLMVSHPLEGAIGHCILKHGDQETILYFIQLLYILMKQGFENQVDEILNAAIQGQKSLMLMIADKKMSAIQSSYLILTHPLLRAIIKGLPTAELDNIAMGISLDVALLNKGLLLAASQGSIRHSIWLVDKGAEIHTQNSDGDTPLHVAIKSAKIKTATALKMKAKALEQDVMILNKQGKSPDFYAGSSKDNAFFAVYDHIISTASSTASSPLSTSPEPSTSWSAQEMLSTVSVVTDTPKASMLIPEPLIASAPLPPSSPLPMMVYSTGQDRLQQEIKEQQAIINKLFEDKQTVDDDEDLLSLFKRANAAMKRIEQRVTELQSLQVKAPNLKQTQVQLSLLHKSALPIIERIEKEKAKKRSLPAVAAAQPKPIKAGKALMVSPSASTPPTSAVTRPLDTYFSEAGGLDVKEEPRITSIRFTALGIEGILGEIDKCTDITNEIANAGLLYELFRLFELLNELPGGGLEINSIRQHLAHDHAVLLTFSASSPCSPVLYDLAKAYKAEDLCSYARARSRGQCVVFNDEPVHQYFSALKIAKAHRRDFLDKRDLGAVLDTLQFAVGILKHFYHRMNPAIGKDAMVLATGSPSLFSACKMAVLIISNVLSDCVVHKIVQAEIQTILGLAEAHLKEIISVIRGMRNRASHIGETVFNREGRILTIYEVHPLEITRLQGSIEILDSYLQRRASTIKPASGSAGFFKTREEVVEVAGFNPAGRP